MTNTLASLIESNNIDWVNPDINEENFPAPKVIRSDFKLYHFNRYIESEEAIEEMEKEGYSPATVYELLSWNGWDGKNLVVALGSVAGVGGKRDAAYLDGSGSERGLDLDWFGDGWLRGYRFLAVRNSQTLKSKSSYLGISDSFSLDLAIQKVKDAGYKIIKEY